MFGSKRLIYIVDDSPDMAKLMARMTQKFIKCKVEVFTNPEKALDSLINGKIKPELVISDLIMPELSGLQLKAKAIEAGSKVPFLFLTAADGKDITSGDNIILSKPIDPYKLERYIKRIIKI